MAGVAASAGAEGAGPTNQRWTVGDRPGAGRLPHLVGPVRPIGECGPADNRRRWTGAAFEFKPLLEAQTHKK